ncbi:hypothetical protein ZYGR_0U03260 [Zygosaccharomyces rouxii]|uniref:ZYRO0F16104p n=2 Tax=Zygosaccharomyces rouxii TaxID=4956 RepID=C5DYV7_ZYGRC|nr:uncharacterized protein ZYRO0F16104g [Zygosaccharomyces rouxii]KAH9201319.1 protein TEX1 [Zygosaccharomyces rouxii]GAV50470.1 hypothetical protein ZYGR_0U03260 [Zygosaccharomyces rouxii]CAQ43403.1 Protein TEX1 [Zygosaccharomyces rouxii]CAR28968.1 ZYRO0F16104p [Zygosaccharomyces rouxii]
MNSNVVNGYCEKLVSGMLNKQHVEAIEDDRYSHVVSRSQSRFAAPISSNRILNLEFHPSGHYMAYSREDGSLTVWRLANVSFARSKKMVIPNAMSRWVSWNHQEISEFATCSGNHELYIWGVDEKKREIVKLRTLSSGNKNNKIERCIFDAQGRWLLSQQGLVLQFWDVKSDYQLKQSYQLDELEANVSDDDVITAVVWTNSGSHVIVGLNSGKMCILQVGEDSVRPLLFIEAHRSAITSMVMDPWGEKLITGGADGSCNIWGLATMCCEKTIDKHSRICCMDVDPSGKILAVTTADNTVQFYDTNELQLLASQNLKTTESDPLIKFYPDKSWFILSGKDDSIERHFTPGNYNDLISFYKVENERRNSRSRIQRKPIKKDSKERARVSKWDLPKTSRFNDRF